MKLAGQRIEGFLRNPDPRVIAVLVYGPDQGLVRERAARIVTAIAKTPSDPFRVVEIPVDTLKDDRSRLADEVSTPAFSGGRRVVRVRDGKDIIVPAVRTLLETEVADGAAIVEAGELGPRSALRLLFESADRAVALACYLDEGETLQRVLVDDLAAHKLTVSAEAADLLQVHLGADRGLTRQELEKLALYMGGPGRISADDVKAVVCGAGSLSLDTVAYAAAGGDFAALDLGLAQAWSEGASAIPILRAVARHLHRILQARTVIAGGGSTKQGMDALKPAVFFRLQPEFRRQTEAWSIERLASNLATLAEAELLCKATRAPQELLCHRALLRVAGQANDGRRG